MRFYSSPGPAGAGPCPAPLGGQCLDLGAPIALLGPAVADAAGTAVKWVTVPAGTPVGAPVTFQAAIVRGAGGVDSDVTQTVTRLVVP